MQHFKGLKSLSRGFGTTFAKYTAEVVKSLNQG